MASRADIRDAFTGELRAVAGTYSVEDSLGNQIETVTLDATDIGLRDPESSEEHPAIVYHDDYRAVTYNGVGTAPARTTRLVGGGVDEEFWREYVEAQFIVDVRSSNEVRKEPIYEALRRRFGKYQLGGWNETDVHADIIDIDVRDSTTVDAGDEEDVIRGDQLEVRITFKRDYSFDTDNIDTIEHQMDADDDGTIDYTYNTT